ncbi:TetR/AcrR family transcriptional regulator [Sphingobium sp. JS3065]|uniref:TetR/AcrR family transcriptional regulator n=1 Tax=Sphingobium sp. JS3065 TaxID=2970925 RepID=UPI002263F10C|nr:TetR/AcrR family transcriptional regulator [Sphingobium sp. JS3065]UZW57493.1 TetR/AcrR family transcriptional regulator [Sphingobium sp. JS3065]
MSEPNVRAGRREQLRLERRQNIVDAASKSFLENGYAGTSMSGLLNTIGGSKATLWSYFRSKEELFAAILEPAISSMRVDVSHTLDSRDSLEAGVADFCRRFMQANEPPEALGLWRLIAAESGRFPEVGRIFREHVVSVTEDELATYFKRGVESGILREEDCHSMARVLLSLCISRLDRKLWSDPTAGPLLSVEAEADWVTSIFLRAFATQND